MSGNLHKHRAGIRALGAYAPANVVSNRDLEQKLDTSDEWIFARTGIRRRHFAAEDEFASHMSVSAVDDLVARHGEAALADVDVVIVATNTPDALFPTTASMVQDHFGLKAGAFDLIAACPGWLYALSVAKGYVEAGMYNKVLAIGAEASSKLLDWNDRSTAVLFGDGAGAAIVEKVPEPFGFRSFSLGADGSGGKHLSYKLLSDKLHDGTELEKAIVMNGQEVFKFAVRVMQSASLEAIERAGMTIDDISLFAPHQANLRIIEAARERLELAPERVALTVEEYGNNSAASIPLALKHALDDGRIAQGDHLLLVSFGAGLTWASTVLTWGGLYGNGAGRD